MARQDVLQHPFVRRAFGITRRAAAARKKFNLPDDQPITREALLKAGLLKKPAAAAAPAASAAAAPASPFGRGGLLGNLPGFGGKPAAPSAPAAAPKPTDSGDPA